MLANVQSIKNKLDELEVWAKLKKEIKETCLLAFTESWLSDSDRDEDFSLSGFGIPIRLDRSPEITGKSRGGGGVCFYVNERFCNTVKVRERMCTTDPELLTISLRPFYLPREFQQLFYTLVYIHPRANATAAAQLIADVMSRLDAVCPDAPTFVLGDLNHCKLNTVLRTHEQYVTCSTTQKSTIIDLCYGTVKGAYTSMPMPSLGASYHNGVYLMPVYKPSFRRVDRKETTVKSWSEDGITSLQACFECTDWQCFYDGCDDMNDLCDAVSSYINFCVDSIIPSKTVVMYPNNKPWVTKELKAVINKKKKIFYTGDPLEKKAVSREVRNEIRKAKIQYRDKIEEQYCSGDLRAAWQGIKQMASINQNSGQTRQLTTISGVNDADLPNAFNSFFSPFERSDFLCKISTLRMSLKPENGIAIAERKVASLFKKVNIRKAAGPDGICGRTLRHCADQLSEVFTVLFQMCAGSGYLPQLWKTSTIIPVPKINHPIDFNHFRPVALTSLVMKNFEKILKENVVSLIDGRLDPLQFAYQAGKGVNDAKLFILDTKAP